MKKRSYNWQVGRLRLTIVEFPAQWCVMWRWYKRQE
jgi:hypothetical protein